MEESNKDYIETAFLQLSFAVKLWYYLELYPIDKNKFDGSLTVKENRESIHFPKNEFNTYNDILLASENNVSICFGAAVITLWEAIKDKGEYSPTKLPNPLATTEQKIAGLIYMIRCCFAHSPAIPRWHITSEKYKIIYSVGSKSIDLRSVNDTRFYYESIGGDCLFARKEFPAEGH